MAGFKVVVKLRRCQTVIESRDAKAHQSTLSEFLWSRDMFYGGVYIITLIM